MVGRYSNGFFKGRKSSLIGWGPNNNFGRLEYFGNYLKEIDIWIDIFNLFLYFFSFASAYIRLRIYVST